MISTTTYSNPEIASFLKVGRSFAFNVKNKLKASVKHVSFVLKRKINSKQSDSPRTAKHSGGERCAGLQKPEGSQKIP